MQVVMDVAKRDTKSIIYKSNGSSNGDESSRDTVGSQAFSGKYAEDKPKPYCTKPSKSWKQRLHWRKRGTSEVGMFQYAGGGLTVKNINLGPS
jgi:hypothetical protein